MRHAVGNRLLVTHENLDTKNGFTVNFVCTHRISKHEIPKKLCQRLHPKLSWIGIRNMNLKIYWGSNYRSNGNTWIKALFLLQFYRVLFPNRGSTIFVTKVAHNLFNYQIDGFRSFTQIARQRQMNKMYSDYARSNPDILVSLLASTGCTTPVTMQS